MPTQESLETSFEGIRYFSACQHVKLKTNAHFQDLAPLTEIIVRIIIEWLIL